MCIKTDYKNILTMAEEIILFKIARIKIYNKKTSPPSSAIIFFAVLYDGHIVPPYFCFPGQYFTITCISFRFCFLLRRDRRTRE